MKKFLFLTLSAIMALSMASCDSGEDTPPAEKYNLTVTPTSLTFEAQDSSTKTITVTAENVEWEAAVENATENSWVSIQTNDDKISVSVSENTGNERKATITVTPKNTTEVTAKTVTVTQKEVVETGPLELEMESAFLLFMGDPNFSTLSTYQVELTDNGKFYYENGETSVEMYGDGYSLIFYFVADEISANSFNNVRLPDGTYNISMNMDSESFKYENMTFLKTLRSGTDYGGSRIMVFKNQKLSETLSISSGTVTVKNSESNVKMTFDLTLDNGRKVSAVFDDSFEFEILGTQNTFDSPLDLELTKGGAMYYIGSEFYEWFIDLTTEGLTVDSSTGKATGTGYHTIFHMFTDIPSVSGTLTSGTYPIIYFTKNAVDPGRQKGGSWIQESNDSNIINQAPFYIYNGTVEISYDNESSIFTITYDAVSDDFMPLKGSFEGPMNIIQGSSSSSAMRSESARSLPYTENESGIINPISFR